MSTTRLRFNFRTERTKGLAGIPDKSGLNQVWTAISMLAEREGFPACKNAD